MAGDVNYVSVAYSLSNPESTGFNTYISKEYDGTADAVFMTPPLVKLTGAVRGETPEAQATYAFTDKNAGDGKSVFASVALTSDWSRNYELSTATLEIANASIMRREIGFDFPGFITLSPIDMEVEVIASRLAKGDTANTVLVATEYSTSANLPYLSNVKLRDNKLIFDGVIEYSTNYSDMKISIRADLGSNSMNYYAAEAELQVIICAGEYVGYSAIPVNQGNIYRFNQYANTDEGLVKHYRLVENVVLDQSYNWTPIGNESRPFTGSFDGSGGTGDLYYTDATHTISNLSIYGAASACQGMFGYITGDREVSGTIQNLGLVNVTITGNADYVGGIAGGNESAITNCFVTGSISGGNYVGGIAGINNFEGIVSYCYTRSNVVGANNVGGIVGINNSNSSVEYCYSNGSVNGGDSIGGVVGYNAVNGYVYCSYSTGNVSGSTYIGGVVGSSFYSSVEYCYASGTIQGSDCVGGVVGIADGGSVSFCVALNASVSAATPNAGRVLGSSSNVSSYNYAILHMPGSIYFTYRGLYEKDGEDISYDSIDIESNNMWDQLCVGYPDWYGELPDLRDYIPMPDSEEFPGDLVIEDEFPTSEPSP